jgi:hypothetical protein
VATDTADERYARLVKSFLKRPGVTQSGRGFGSSALKINGRMFATLSHGGALVVKLPKGRVDALVAEGTGQRFEPGPGRIMREWIALGPGTVHDWTVLVAEAITFVSRETKSTHSRPAS